jgi:type IV pilus assembly protein PilP
MKIILLLCVIFIFLPVSKCLGQSFEPEIITEQDDSRIEDLEEFEIEGSEEAMPEGKEEAMTEAQDESEKELPEDDYHYNPVGKRDPFYSKMLEEKKKIEPNKKVFGVQRYELAELKLVGIIWGELGRKGVVETPEGKSYLVKVGTLIGKNGGVVKAITNQEVVIQEFVTDYLGNNIENISIIKIQRKEQEE